MLGRKKIEGIRLSDAHLKDGHPACRSEIVNCLLGGNVSVFMGGLRVPILALEAANSGVLMSFVAVSLFISVSLLPTLSIV